MCKRNVEIFDLVWMWSGFSAVQLTWPLSGSCWCVESRGFWHSCRYPPRLHTRPCPTWHPAQCSSQCGPPPHCHTKNIFHEDSCTLKASNHQRLELVKTLFDIFRVRYACSGAQVVGTTWFKREWESLEGPLQRTNQGSNQWSLLGYSSTCGQRSKLGYTVLKAPVLGIITLLSNKLCVWLGIRFGMKLLKNLFIFTALRFGWTLFNWHSLQAFWNLS